MNKKFSKYPRQYKFAWLINYAKLWEANRFWKTDSCRNGAIQIRKSNSKANLVKQSGEKVIIIYRNTKLQHESIWERIFWKYEFSISMTKECESHELFSFSAFEWEKAGFLSAAPVSQAWIYLGAPSVFPSPSVWVTPVLPYRGVIYQMRKYTSKTWKLLFFPWLQK